MDTDIRFLDVKRSTVNKWCYMPSFLTWIMLCAGAFIQICGASESKQHSAVVRVAASRSQHNTTSGAVTTPSRLKLCNMPREIICHILSFLQPCITPVEYLCPDVTRNPLPEASAEWLARVGEALAATVEQQEYAAARDYFFSAIVRGAAYKYIYEHCAVLQKDCSVKKEFACDIYQLLLHDHSRSQERGLHPRSYVNGAFFDELATCVRQCNTDLLNFNFDRYICGKMIGSIIFVDKPAETTISQATSIIAALRMNSTARHYKYFDTPRRMYTIYPWNYSMFRINTTFRVTDGCKRFRYRLLCAIMQSGPNSNDKPLLISSITQRGKFYAWKPVAADNGFYVMMPSKYTYSYVKQGASSGYKKSLEDAVCYQPEALFYVLDKESPIVGTRKGEKAIEEPLSPLPPFLARKIIEQQRQLGVDAMEA